MNDTVVWISGAGTGLGRALALEYGRVGAHVVLSGRRPAPLEEVASEVRGQGGQALVVAVDVADETALARATEQVVAWRGRLDIVIANAGFACAGNVRDLSVADFRRQFDVNFFGLIAMAKLTLPHLERTRGRLAFIGSVAAFHGLPKSGAYSASKAAVRSLGQTLRNELHGTGVSCTVIHPGFVESDIYKVRNDQRIDETRADARPKALMWKADRAAKVMARAIEKRKSDFVFTGHGRFSAFLMQHTPCVAHWVLRSSFARKGSQGFDKSESKKTQTSSDGDTSVPHSLN